MPLSPSQKELVSQYGSEYKVGLSSSLATSRRVSLNVVPPPINCPKWVCCLLPCIKHIPSMKLFRQIQPEDAEVLREGSWVCYDAPSVVKGDIIRLTEGDTVPADCIVLSLGMNHVSEGEEDGEAEQQQRQLEELMVSVKHVTGETRPRKSFLRSDGKITTTAPTQLFYGGQVLQGATIALVTAVGNDTLLASKIRDKTWPPTAVGSLRSADEEEGVDVALLTRDS